MLDALPAAVVTRFEREGWMLTRSYNDEIGATFAEAFGTGNLADVQRYCRANAIEFAWQADGGLRTRQRRPAVVRHPLTGRRCWFNQIAFLNQWTLDPDVREYLVEVYGEDGLPFNTCFGNGDPIDEGLVALLNDVYEAHTIREPWQDGDLMLVDNIRTAHSREAYIGPREVYVGMAEPVRVAGLAAPGCGRAVMSPATVPQFAVIPGAQVQRALAGREKQVVELVEATYRWHDAGESVNPPSYFLRFPDRPAARIIALPASLGGDLRVDGLKWISSFPDNVQIGLRGPRQC